jgi:hypothetical protein
VGMLASPLNLKEQMWPPDQKALPCCEKKYFHTLVDARFSSWHVVGQSEWQQVLQMMVEDKAALNVSKRFTFACALLQRGLVAHSASIASTFNSLIMFICTFLFSAGIVLVRRVLGLGTLWPSRYQAWPCKRHCTNRNVAVSRSSEKLALGWANSHN